MARDVDAAQAASDQLGEHVQLARGLIKDLKRAEASAREAAATLRRVATILAYGNVVDVVNELYAPAVEVVIDDLRAAGRRADERIQRQSDDMARELAEMRVVLFDALRSLSEEDKEHLMIQAVNILGTGKLLEKLASERGFEGARKPFRLP